MKTPFELRYDLLSLATEHLTAQYQANVKFVQNLSEDAIVLGTEAATKIMPQYPTIEDVVTQAKKFYAFVDSAK